MRMSECCESFSSRRTIDSECRSSSSGEEEGDAKDKSSEQGSNRGGDAAPDFSRSRKLQPGQDRRPLQRFYLEGTFAVPRIAGGTTAGAVATIRATCECPA